MKTNSLYLRFYNGTETCVIFQTVEDVISNGVPINPIEGPEEGDDLDYEPHFYTFNEKTRQFVLA